MPNSPPPSESPGKVEESPADPGTLPRFKQLAARLFGLDRTVFREAETADEAERARRRALNARPPGRRKKG